MTRTKTGIFAAGALVAAMIAAVLALCAPTNAWAIQESEPNDSFAKANTISLGTYVHGLSMPAVQGTWVSTEGPGDYYKVYIPENGQYMVTFANEEYEDWPTWSTNMKASIYNKYYQKMDTVYADYNNTKPNSKTFVMSKGDVYIHVADGALSGLQVHQYKVRITPVINKTSITKVVAGKKSATVKFKKKIGSSKYEVRYSLKSSMKSAKVKTVKASKSSVKVTKLKKNKKYYFQVRVVKNLAGKTFYSGWSAKKSVKIVR